MKRAHDELAAFEEPVPERKKVRMMLRGIRGPHEMVQAINTVEATPQLLQDFQQTVNFFTRVRDRIAAKNPAPNTRRHLATTQTDSVAPISRGG